MFIRGLTIKAVVSLTLAAVPVSVLLTASASAQNTAPTTVSMPATAETIKPGVLTLIEQRMRKPVTVNFKETPIDDVLMALSQQAKVDIIKSPKVTGTVTASLTNVPLNEVLNNILAVQGYAYVPSENMIRVIPAADVAIDQQKLVSKVYRVMYADVKDVAGALKDYVSKAGEISYSVGTSDIIITDTEDKMNAIDTFIKEIDRVTPQVLVEARIYDISSDDTLDLGIKWEAGRIGVDQETTITQGTNSSTGITNSPFLGGDVGGLGNALVDPTGKTKTDPFATGLFNSGTDYTGSGDGLLRFGFLNKYVNIDAILKAEQRNGSAKLLASPRVLVLENQKASIKIVEEIPYQDISQTSSGGNIGAITFKNVGVTLEVTPHITTDGLVRLNLKPTFSTVVRNVTVNVPGTSFTSQVPVIDTRETSTIALVNDAQTVVLGGLLKKTTNSAVNKVPVLGDLPLVGLLFRFKGESVVNSELLVFITPHIKLKPAMTPHEIKRLGETDIVPPNADAPLILDKLDKN